MLYVLGWLLTFAGMVFTYFGSTLSILSILLIPGICLIVLAFIGDNNKQKNERARFLMMSQDEAQRYLNDVQDPQLRIKLIKDWRQNHISKNL